MQGGGAGAESLCLVMLRTLRVWESGCACEALALITTCESAMVGKCLSLKMQLHREGKMEFRNCTNQRRAQILGCEVRRGPRGAEKAAELRINWKVHADITRFISLRWRV